jgi:hypothetical protein
MSHASVARAFVRVSAEVGAGQFAGVGRSHVSHWVAGTRPSGQGPTLLAEALSRQLGRRVTPDEIGLGDPPSNEVDGDVDLARRRVLATGTYSLTALAPPGDTWWRQMPGRGRARIAMGRRVVCQGDVDALQDMVSMFSAIDQRRGGGHARTAAVRYLTTDVAACLHGTFRTEHIRRGLFTHASELAYLCGWMAFDNARHGLAQRFFTVAVKLAAEADAPAMAGHVLRAMAHQAVDLGHRRHALELAEASVTGERYTSASTRERALLGVVHARALALAGERRQAVAALNRAEQDLATASGRDDDPARVFFFGEASLAHQTACTLRELGDLDGAAAELGRSVRTRDAGRFARTHAVTLGDLGEVQIRQGDVDRACDTWSHALKAMEGVRSGRTRQVAVTMRGLLAPFGRRNVRAVSEVDARAAAYLADAA